MSGVKGCRVLVVEDHAETAEGLVELLRLWGHEPHLAATGEGALALARELPPQVVLSDVGLPGIDGFELARRLRLEPGGAELLVVAMTGDRDGAAREYAAAGFDLRLVKPVDLDALERLLEERSSR